MEKSSNKTTERENIDLNSPESQKKLEETQKRFRTERATNQVMELFKSQLNKLKSPKGSPVLVGKKWFVATDKWIIGGYNLIQNQFTIQLVHVWMDMDGPRNLRIFQGNGVKDSKLGPRYELPQIRTITIELSETPTNREGWATGVAHHYPPEEQEEILNIICEELDRFKHSKISEDKITR